MHKRIFWIVGLILMPILALAEVNNISISGEVVNAQDRQVQIVLYSFVPGEENKASSTELDGSNNFQFIAYLREPLFGRIFYGKHSLAIYVAPGDQLQVTFDATEPGSTLTFSGDHAAENTYLAKHFLTYGLTESALREQAKKKTAQEFADWAKQRREVQLNFLATKSDVLSPAFVATQQANIDYQWANELFTYATVMADSKSKRSKLPENYYSFVDEVKLHNYDVIMLESYRSFLANYLKYLYTSTYNISPEQDNEYYNRMYAITAENLRSLPKFHMQAVYLVNAINFLGLDAVKDEYIEFANECPMQPYKNELHELIKMQNVFEVNKPKVVFKVKDGQSIPLKQLKGNIVLVRFDNDVHSVNPEELTQQDEKLKSQLAGFKDVKFLQLSMEENRDAYERMVYADANDYLKSIINRPKPGQLVQLPAWSYVVLNRDGLVVSNSLDDPNNELAVDKIKVFLQQEEQIAEGQTP